MKRQSDREGNNHDRPRKNHRRPIRLLLEPLEARRLLAGLNVSVLVDHDGSRTSDAADTAASRRVVFLDLNKNGLQDSTDPVAFTNDRGIANFDVEPGDYAVGIAGGSSLQSQAFPTRVDDLATNVGPAAKTLIASDDLSQVWAFDGDGQGQLISSTPGTAKVWFGGAIIGSVSVGADAWVIVRSSGTPSGTKLVQFNLASGQQTSTEVRGLNGRAIDKLVKAGSEVVAQLSGPRGIELAKVSVVGGVPTIGVSASFPNLFTLTGAPNQLAIVEYQSDVGLALAMPTQPVAKKLSVLDLKDFTVQATTLLSQAANEISMSADGRLVIAAMSSGGVLVLNNDASLSAVAKLAEATGPLLTQSKDGRIVTGNATNSFEFIVWDTSSWQPSGRTRVTTSTPTSTPILTLTNGVVSNAVLASSGDRLIATGMIGTVASQLAKPTTAEVTVPVAGTATVELGVRINGVNKAPTTSPVTATFLEDNTSGGSLRSQVSDAENDTLWFDVLSAPAHGSLRVTPTGDWIYQPKDNFNGSDRAVVRVFDGQASSELSLVLNVTPVNDPPSDLRAVVFTIPETLTAPDTPEVLGYVSISDVDQGSNYLFESLDPRFQVRNGRIYLVPGAKLDFETEPTIKFEIIATEDVVSGYQISTTATLSIADVNEPPTAVRILNTSVPENIKGATLGQLQIDDPDQVNNFQYVLSDSRFMVENGLLKLRPGIELDFEQASSINMSVTVSDTSGQSITQSISVQVTNQNDPPTAINVQVSPLVEATPGAVVGAISVNDQDLQTYNFAVSDARFEVVDGTLRLKEGQSVSKSIDQNLNLTVTATSVFGNDTIAGTVAIPVVAKKSALQNVIEPRDVNGDGEVTPLDALILINYINSFGTGPVQGNAPRGGSGEGQVWIDVNGDGVISPIDILIIINWLNRRRLTEAMPAEGEDNQLQPVFGPASPVAKNDSASTPEPLVSTNETHPSLANTSSIQNSSFSSVSASEHFESAGLACPAVETLTNSEIDHELESLLDQLSRERLTFTGG